MKPPKRYLVNVDTEVFVGCCLGSMRVYIIAPKDLSRCKIGMTNDVKYRLKSLESQSGVPLQLLASVNCCCREHAMHIEKSLHYQLRHRRGIGEWFVLGANELESLVDIFSTISSVLPVSPNDDQELLRYNLFLVLAIVDCVEQQVVGSESGESIVDVESEVSQVVDPFSLADTPYNIHSKRPPRVTAAVECLILLLVQQSGMDRKWAKEIISRSGIRRDQLLNKPSKVDALKHLESVGLVTRSQWRVKGCGRYEDQIEMYQLTDDGIKKALEVMKRQLRSGKLHQNTIERYEWYIVNNIKREPSVLDMLPEESVN